MKKKANSIKTIAEELNVSITTVSFVLNGKAEEKHISSKMSQKILEYTKSINYKPNRIAQCLRTGKSKILVFMVKDISDRSFSKLARVFEDLAYENGYKVVFCSNDNDDIKSTELIDFYDLLQVDGFVFVSSSSTKYKIDQLIEEGKPVVLLEESLIKKSDGNLSLIEIANNLMESMLKLIND